MSEELNEGIIHVAYIISAILFIVGLKRLSAPATARQGNQLAIAAMTLAFLATLIDREIVSYWSIIIGTLIGGGIGLYLARAVQMTAMPQLVALFNGMGGGTAAVIAVGEFLKFARDGDVSTGEALSVAFGVTVGAIAFSGSMVAGGKLQEILPSGAIRSPIQMPLNILLVIGVVAFWVSIVALGGGSNSIWAMLAIALALGVVLVIPIGGADMPVVVALLNSMTGLAAAAAGFVLENQILVVAGALVGASGMLLTLLMSKAMNRPLSNVFFGAFGAVSGGPAAEGEAKPIRETTPDDAAVMLGYAQNVIIVPGYGLAVAQAQHAVRELADLLQSRGCSVKYAIHPVAGRMPGHMNVLLAEADVPYEQLVEMDEINSEFKDTDVAIVLGANDVVNPAAQNEKGSPIYGMPILQVYNARSVFVVKRSLGAGFAGIKNTLFEGDNTNMVFGDAKKVLQGLIAELKEASK
jgi:H+-translocating NAD(P) transhydrogenase subunit beta